MTDVKETTAVAETVEGKAKKPGTKTGKRKKTSTDYAIEFFIKIAVNAGEEICYKFDGETKFGRIVAKAGDEVSINDSYVMVNGYGITEDVVYPTTSEGAAVTFPYVVQDGAVFVMNDFRDDIKDSRTYGAIPLENCEGKVILVIRRRGI